MKNFLLRIHYLITNPAYFVHSYRNEQIGAIVRFVLMVAVVMLGSSAMIRTVKVIRELPPVVGLAFDGVVIENGTLTSANGTIVPKKWQNEEISAILSGRSTDVEFLPESLVVVSPEGSLIAPITLTSDSLLINFAESEKSKKVHRFAKEWKEILPFEDKVELSEQPFAEKMKENSFSLFIGMVMTLGVNALGDLVTYLIMLLLLIFIYRRDLSEHWVKKSTIKILLNGLVPYFILLPMFSVAGNRADLLSSVAIVTSAIIISRAFRFHRISLLMANNKKEEL